ncbi:MAG TPA: formate--tetrahydrofolate ligase, partial [Thermoplasmata archaeon]|nr:formate--tetrahydrofolate ligase [Thermoplasmata archaeon]
AIEAGLAGAEYCVVEAGFASDLGAEKFVDIVARDAGLTVDAALLVVTVRGLRHHGGAAADRLDRPDPDAARRGLANVDAHLAIVRALGIPPVVVLNRYPDDSPEEREAVRDAMAAAGVPFSESTAFGSGAEGATEVAARAVEATPARGASAPLYDDESPIPNALEVLVKRVYGGDGADWTDRASAELAELARVGEARSPVCVAKTALSLSDDPSRLGRPRDYRVSVRSVTRSAGAGFSVVYLGEIETMPGLPRRPLAEGIDLTDDGRIVGLV